MAPATLALVQAKAGRTPTTAEKALSRAGLTVPVELVAAESSMSFQACAGGMCRRTDDEAWWNSGGRVRMRHATNQPFYGACTSGFAVLYLGTTYLLTAAHCATWHAGLGDWFYDGAGELIGRASIVEDWDKDIMLIDARGWYWMWDGSTTTTNHRTVRSWASPAWNELVCLSGAFSGTQCSLEVDLGTFAYQLTDSDGDTFIVHGMTRACRPVGSPSPSQSGDSGAPVFTLDGSGVRAKGIHSGGDGRCILFQGMGNITSARSGAWPGVTPYTG
jgi:streptogrisin D